MAALALISDDPTLYATLVRELDQTEWSVQWVDADKVASVGIDQDVVVLDGSGGLPQGWQPPGEKPVLMVVRTGRNLPESTELATDIVFRDSLASEILLRLQRLQARTPLEAVRRRYVETFASMAPGIVVLGPHLEMVFANPRAYEIVGHRPETIDGEALEHIIAPEDWPRVRGALEHGDYPRGTDIQFIRREGTKIVCSASFAPMVGAQGHTVVSFEDVTDERETERELLKTMQFLESLIDGSVDAIIATDMARRIVLFNPSAESIAGRLSSDAIGVLTLEDLFGHMSADLVMQRLLSEDHGGPGRLEPTMLELVDFMGKHIPVQLSASVIYEREEPSAIVLIFADLRDQIRVENRLAEAQKKLAFREKQSVLAELAGTAAHELNQPLTSMMAYAELLLRQSEAGSVAAKAAEVLIREAERMAEIVRKIGKITRYETTSYVGQQKIFDLDRAAETPNPDPGADG